MTKGGRRILNRIRKHFTAFGHDLASLPDEEMGRLIRGGARTLAAFRSPPRPDVSVMAKAGRQPAPA